MKIGKKRLRSQLRTLMKTDAPRFMKLKFIEFENKISWINITRIPGDATTNFSAAATTTSGGNPQVVYNQLPFPNQIGETCGVLSLVKLGAVQEYAFGISFKTAAEETDIQGLCHHPSGTYSISPPVSIHRVKPCVNPAARIPGDATTNFSAAAATTSGGNPQVAVTIRGHKFLLAQKMKVAIYPNHTAFRIQIRYIATVSLIRLVDHGCFIIGEAGSGSRIAFGISFRTAAEETCLQFISFTDLALLPCSFADANHTSPSVSNHRKRTPENSQAIPTTSKVGTSKRARCPPTTGGSMSIGRSNGLPPTRAGANTKGCSSVARAGEHLLCMLYTFFVLLDIYQAPFVIPTLRISWQIS
ncbi:hypothetical protein Tco_0158078 [Tanacetum coccineum]